MATGTGNLPYSPTYVSPFDIITSQAENETQDNISALADGSGIGDGALNGAVVLQNNSVTAAKIEAQQTWVNVTFQGAWVNYDTVNFYPVSYMKDSLGFVHLRGLAKSGSTAGTIFILPAGYRPLKTSYHIATNAQTSNVGIVNIGANGNVKIDSGNNTFQSFDGLIFKAEQ